MEKIAVRLVLSGRVQDSPFLEALAARIGKRAASVRRVGAGLEVRVAGLGARTPGAQKAAARRLVAGAARAAGLPVRVESAEPLADAELAPGIHFPPPQASGAPELQPTSQSIGPDLPPCRACAREITQDGRRHGYLQTECLRCGPRFSQARGFPLTRAHYGLDSHPPCASCRDEVHDPRSRRFGFERASCAHCGPTLTLLPPSGPPFLKASALRAAEHLHAGGVVAIQTPYGYWASAAPTSASSLRVELGNEFVPLALVTASASQASRTAPLSTAEERALGALAAPEVLVRLRPTFGSLARELSPFGPFVPIRLAESHSLARLAGELGPLVCAPASRGGLILPQHRGEGGSLPSAWWLTDGLESGLPLLPSRVLVAGGKTATLALGRGLLPASFEAGHGRTVLAFGGGRECFGAAAHGGAVFPTGCAGPSSRGESSERLKRFLSQAAAVSAAASADAIDAVAAAPEYGTGARLAAEEAAERAGCPVVEVSSAWARAAAAQDRAAGRESVLVLELDEPSGGEAKAIGAERTGGELLDLRARRVIGGIAPYEILSSPADTRDLVQPLLSALERAGAELPGGSEDEPILALLRTRAHRATSFVVLADGAASLLGLVPRRAPRGSGLAEISRYLDDGAFSRRYPFKPRLARARGSRQLDAVDLLGQLITHRQALAAREGHSLPHDRRAALAASFAFALFDGVARASRVSLRRGARVVVTGSGVSNPALAILALERLRAHGLAPSLPRATPILDGAIPIGQARLAGAK